VIWLDVPVEVLFAGTEHAMRFLILTEPTEPTDPAEAPAMARYHEELVRAGVLLAGDLTAGFWLVEVDSFATAAEWGRRAPSDTVEIREVHDEFRSVRQAVPPWDD
jgi:hypothetical protein